MTLFSQWQPEADFEIWAGGLSGYLWVLVYQGTAVGLLHGKAYQSPFPPHWRGMVDSYYVEPQHRPQAWRLWRHGIRQARALGITLVSIVTQAEMVPFWHRHHFAEIGSIMERKV